MDLTPSPAYDPVARVVSLTPLSPLQPGQNYQLAIAGPGSPNDPNGVRSVGGTTLDPTVPTTIGFLAVAGSQTALTRTADFCKDIVPIFLTKCGGGDCHSGSSPADGLELDRYAAIKSAIGRIAEGSNVGTVASPPSLGCASEPCPPFGIDMPIIDPGLGSGSAGDPANSWLLYKLLLATPSPCPDIGDAGDCDAGAGPSDGPVVGPPGYHDVTWYDLSPDARGTLANLITGAPMPHPALVAKGLYLGDLENLNLWIAAGAPMVSTCAALPP
jgi:hypothetical protein